MGAISIRTKMGKTQKQRIEEEQMKYLKNFAKIFSERDMCLLDMDLHIEKVDTFIRRLETIGEPIRSPYEYRKIINSKFKLGLTYQGKYIYLKPKEMINFIKDNFNEEWFRPRDCTRKIKEHYKGVNHFDPDFSCKIFKELRFLNLIDCEKFQYKMRNCGGGEDIICYHRLYKIKDETLKN